MIVPVVAALLLCIVFLVGVVVEAIPDRAARGYWNPDYLAAAALLSGVIGVLLALARSSLTAQ